MSFPSGECVNDVVNNQKDFQFTSVIVMHFRNGIEGRWTFFKDLQGLIQFWATESLLKRMKNAFYFNLKALSVL